MIYELDCLDYRMKWWVEKEGWDIKTCTCLNCPQNYDCEFAFDLYNTDGDCLAEK